ncbi:hypothetical protein D3C76_1284120 [compost metagenome]
MEQEHHNGIDGEPWRIEKCEQPRPGEELSQRREVVERLGSGIRTTTGKSSLEARAIDITAKHHVQTVADPHHDTRTHPLQGPHGHNQHRHDQCQHEQSGCAAGRHHAARHLNHEEGGHQHQGVNEETEEADRKKAALAGFEGGLQVIFGLRTHGIHTEKGESGAQCNIHMGSQSVRLFLGRLRSATNCMFFMKK